MMDGSRPTLDDLVSELEAEAPIVVRENPKETMSRGKRPDYSAIPETVLCILAAVYERGALKYGRYNWPLGHEMAAFAGDWHDNETGVPHRAHAIATQGILIDAEIHGTLIHDLPQTDGVFRKVHEDAAAKVSRFAAAWEGRLKRG